MKNSIIVIILCVLILQLDRYNYVIQQRKICNIREHEIAKLSFKCGYYSKPGPIHRGQFIIDSLHFNQVINE